MNRVTPYCLTGKALTRRPGLMMQYTNPTVGAAGSYKHRDSLVLTAEQAALPNEAIAEVAWSTFQNIDEDRLTPDGGRSMMTGDLVLVEIDGRKPAWMMTMACGFSDVTEIVGGRDMEQKGRSESSDPLKK